MSALAADAHAPSRAGARAAGALRVEMVLPSLAAAGMETVVATLARALVTRGHDVGITCLEEEGPLAAPLRASDVRVAVAGAPGLLANLHAPALTEHLRRLAPDVVHTHSGVWPKAAQAARRAGARAVVHTEHGLRDHEPWYDPALKRWAARRSDVVVAVSTSLAAYLTGRVRVPATRVATLLNGVDTARFAPAPRDAAVRARLGVPAGVPLVGTVARLAPVKNQAMLLDAFAALLARVPDAHLVLAGDGELRDALEAQAARLRITARVHLPGALADTAPIYRELDAFVLCSFGEGTSISLLEAMATGVPSVATAVGGNPATVAHGEAGLLVPSGDAAALTEALARVLGEPAVGAALGAAARRHVLALYGEAAMADGYESVYRRALAPTSGG